MKLLIGLIVFLIVLLVLYFVEDVPIDDNDELGGGW